MVPPSSADGTVVPVSGPMSPAAPSRCQPLQGEGVWGSQAGSCCRQPCEPEITRVTPQDGQFCVLGIGSRDAAAVARWRLCSRGLGVQLYGALCPRVILGGAQPCAGVSPMCTGSFGEQWWSPGWELMLVGLGAEPG